MIDFNTEPYNDDYDENKKFYRILYRPSFAVQARELTQMQTILQNQISRHGDAIFKQGAMVIPGQASVETLTQPNKGSDYVKLQPIYNGVAVQTFLTALQGKTIVGSSGVTAQVFKIQDAEGTDPTTLYVRYTTTGSNNTTKTFSDSEVITTEDGAYSFQAASSASVGKGSLATIARGVYYINKHFCLVEEQSIVLEKYSNTPTYRVGLVVTESLVTPESDETLLDNAQNSYNYAAPGAHRYYMDLTLTKLSVDSVTDTNFIELIRVVDGNIKTIVEKTDYSLLGEELARRTMDESGDYTVREFALDVREHRNNDRGAWLQNTSYLYGDIVTNGGYTYVAKNSGTSVTTAPTHTSNTAYDGPGSTGIKWEFTTTPVYNRGIYKTGDAGKLAIGLEPGKAYVNGWEIQKDSTTYLEVNKARDYAQALGSIIQPAVGNYVLVTNVNNLPPVDTLATISLRQNITGTSVGTAQGSEIGTARVRIMEWDSGATYGSTAVYKLSLFDVQMNSGYSFNRDVKSFYYAGASAYLSFSADINPIWYQLPNSSVTASSTTVTGVGTAFLTDLKVNDLILIGDSNYRRVTAIADNGSLTIDSVLSIATGVSIKRATTQILEANNTSLVFPLANYAVRAMRGAGNSGVNNTTYTCYQKFTQTASGTTLSLSTSGTFASASGNTNYIVVDNNNGTYGGTVINPVSIVPTGSTCVITLPANQSGHSMTVIAAVTRNGSGYEKTKTLTSATETFTTAALAQQSTVYLDKADVSRIISIKMAPAVAFGSTPTSAQYTLDISDRYEFDNGQRSTHYDWGRLNLKPSFAAPSNPIQVVYEYFTHGVGDYFDVNSYSSIDYSEIPQLLRDSIDYRPRVADKSAGSAKNFVSTNASVTGLPKRGENISSDYSYYLARKDKIAIDKNGKFFDIVGVPSINPGDPADPSLGMVLYNIELQPYTFGASTDNVKVNKIENKRYTMRDIGKLESRINNLEYYTSLSLLEQETQSLKITDSTGMDRMKNGFIVDNFTGNNIGDGSSKDYFCSIDMENGQLRPFYTSHNVNLLEKNSNSSQRSAANYQLNGDIITLPIIDTPVLVKQEYASRLENINPFAIYTFLGNVNINPPSDDWFETTRLPDIVQQVEGNYNTIKQLAEKSGILGTVWGSWNTEWIGTPVSKGAETLTNNNASRDKLNSIAGNWSSNGGYNLRSVKVENFATPIGQSRTGVKTSVAVKTDYETVADRVVSSAVIPYIRSRNILIQTKSLKPSTRFYAYFDDIDVNAYVTPSTKMVYTANSGTFDITTNVGGSASETKRRIGGDSQICLNRGDVITNSAGTASAVVVGKYVDPVTGVLSLDLQNVIGTFSATQTFTGSVSGASGTVVSISTPTTLTTNASGELSFIFNIPETDAIRFRTGARELKLIDTSTSTGQWSSRGRGIYRAEGILDTKQANVNAVRNAEIVKEMVGPNDDPAARQTIYQTSQKVLSDTGWYDPLAQSFLVQQKGGAFLTGIDVFFATKDAAIPVSLEIREMVNGTPGKNVLAFSHTVLNPSQVNLSSTLVTLDGTDYPTYDTPTRFTFTTPVYVENNVEYCFVLQSDSNNYKVWISNMGDTIPGTSGRTISSQPYAGVLFKSQNASTWTPDQNQDMKFTIYRAQFDTSVVGSVDFVNDVIPKDTLDTDPVQTVSGTNTVRVWHYDHGMYVGSRVTISGITADVNGIPASELNGDHVIVTADSDCYTFSATTNATSSGYSGGTAVKATRNITYDLINPSLQMQTFSDTKCSFNIKTTSGKSVDGGQTPYIADTTVSPCLVKEDTYFYTPRVIASEINEVNSALGGAKSVTFTALISTTNDAVSPVIDTARASLVAISNSINSPTEANTNVAALDTKTIFTGSTGAYAFTATGFTSTNSTVRGLMASIGIGRYVTLAGSSNSGNNGTYLVTNFSDNGTTATITLGGFTGTVESVTTSGVSVALRELFFDEIAPSGSSTTSKYVTTPVKFNFSSTYMRIKFAANIPNEADIKVYYKTSLGDSAQLASTKYTLITPDSTITKVENGNDAFYDADYSLSGMTPFDGIVIKIVMQSTNSCAVPVIRDLRIIACP